MTNENKVIPNKVAKSNKAFSEECSLYKNSLLYFFNLLVKNIRIKNTAKLYHQGKD